MLGMKAGGHQGCEEGPALVMCVRIWGCQSSTSLSSLNMLCGLAVEEEEEGLGPCAPALPAHVTCLWADKAEGGPWWVCPGTHPPICLITVLRPYTQWTFRSEATESPSLPRKHELSCSWSAPLPPTFLLLSI